MLWSKVEISSRLMFGIDSDIFWPDGNMRPPDLPLEKHICKSGSNS